MRLSQLHKNSRYDFKMASCTHEGATQNHNSANMSKIDKMS